MLKLPLDNIKLLLQCIQEWNSPAKFISMDSDIKSIDYLNYHNALHIHVCTTTHKEQSGFLLNSIYLIDISTLLVLDSLFVCRSSDKLKILYTWVNEVHLTTWNNYYNIPIYPISLNKEHTKQYYLFHYPERN